MRKYAITLLGMALLVAFSGFAARAYAFDAPQTACSAEGGWFDPDINTCEMQAP
jgi:hypothetical protein